MKMSTSIINVATNLVVECIPGREGGRRMIFDNSDKEDTTKIDKDHNDNENKDIWRRAMGGN